MESIPRKKRQWKIKVKQRRKDMEAMMDLEKIDDIDIKVALIQALIPEGLKAVNEKLQEEVRLLAGKRYQHGKENTRWGTQAGSVYLLDQKVPLTVPRLRSKARNLEVPLEYYQKLQEPYQGDKQVLKKLLNGLSTHKYRESAELAPEVFGISASNMSLRFKKATAAKLRQLQERRLDRYDFIAVFVDGKRYAKEGIMISLGITTEGEKVILGIEQMSTENSRSMEQFFQKLIERGLTYKDGILFVIDGSKGIMKAVEIVFSSCAVIHRCQFHKIENVVSYLPKGLQGIWRLKLRAAYKQARYDSAKAALRKLEAELDDINPSAANSLREGLEETLSLHRLGVYAELGKSLASTNCIESVMSQVGQYTDKVNRWRGGSHIQRWVAAGLLEIEPRLHKIYGYRHLNLLRIKLREEINRRQEKQPIGNATSDDLAVSIH